MLRSTGSRLVTTGLVLAVCACGPADPSASMDLLVSPPTPVEQGLIIWGKETLSADVDGCNGSDAGLGSALVVTSTTLVASAPQACSAFNDTDREGAIVVFDREAGAWRAGDVIRRGTPGNLDRLGASLAFAEPHLVAGVPGAGAVEVFVRVGRRFLSQATLTRPLGAPPPTQGSGFGEAVAVGTDTIIVGAENATDGSTTGAGVAFVFVRTGEAWQSAQILSAPTPRQGGHFGRRLTTNGSHAVVAGEDEVHVYRRGASNFVFQQTFAAIGVTNVVISGTRFAVGRRNGSVDVYARQLDGSWGLEDSLDVTGATAGARAVGFGGAQLVVADAAGVASYVATGGLGLTDDPAWTDDGRVTDATGGAAAVVSGGGFVVVGGNGELASFRRVASNGEPCSVGSECLSGFCIDGVCCNSLCGAGVDNCLACSVAAGGAVDGVCGTAVAGTVCRTSLGACDAPEVCNGIDDTCPTDALRPGNTVCRAESGPCDVAERCTGTSPGCPRDEFRDVGEVCRASVGDCDIVDVCDGLSGACPDDEVKQAGTPCRGRFGVCDEAESCDGAGPLCPADGFKPYGTSCRAPTGQCDAEEVCQGISADCPPDEYVDDGTACIDGDVCTEGDTCTAGRCTPGPDLCGDEQPREPAPPPPFDEVPPPPVDEETGGCAATPSAPLWSLALLLALAGVRRRRAPLLLMMVALFSGGALAADADGDTIDDTIDRCAVGDDRIDTDNDGTPDACDCAPNDPGIHPAAPDVCDDVDNNCDLRVDRQLALSARGAELLGQIGRGEAINPAGLALSVPAGSSQLRAASSFRNPNNGIYYERPVALRTVGGARRALVLLDRVPTDGDNDTVVAFSDGTRIVTYGLYDSATGYLGRIGPAVRSGQAIVPGKLVAPSPDTSFIRDVEDERFVITFTATPGRTQAIIRGANGTVLAPTAVTGTEALDPDLPWTFMLVGNTRGEAYTLNRVEVWQTVPNDDGGTDDDADGYSDVCDCDDNNASVNPGARETCAFGDNDCRITPFDEQEPLFSRGGAGMLGEIANLIARPVSNRTYSASNDVLQVSGGSPLQMVYRVPLGVTSQQSTMTIALGAGAASGSVLFGLTDGTRYRALFALRQNGRLDLRAFSGSINGESLASISNIVIASTPSRLVAESSVLRATFSDGNVLKAQAGGPEVSLLLSGSTFAAGVPLQAFVAPFTNGPLLLSGLDITVPGPDADLDGVCDLSDACQGFDGDVDNDGDGVRNLCDCNDNVASIHPNARESCDGVDQDCDGRNDLITRGGTIAERRARIAQVKARQDFGYAEDIGTIGDALGHGRFTLRHTGLAAFRDFASVLIGDRAFAIARDLDILRDENLATIEIRSVDSTSLLQTSQQQIGVIRTPNGVEEEPAVVVDYLDDGDGVRLRISPPPTEVFAPHTLLDDGSVLLAIAPIDLTGAATLTVSAKSSLGDITFSLPDDDLDLVCNEVDRCEGGDDGRDADTDGTPDSCDICLGPDGDRDLDGDSFPDRCDCDDDRAGVSPDSIDECDGRDNDCDGLVDVHTALSVRGGELITRLTQGQASGNVGQRPLTGLAGGTITEIGAATVDAPPLDVYFREALSLQPAIGGERFTMVVDRDTLVGDHDFIVGVSNGTRFFGVTLENDGVAGTSYLVATVEANDVGASLAGAAIGASTRIPEDPPYTLEFRLDDGVPRIEFLSDGGATAVLTATQPGALNTFGDRLDAVLVADSPTERYRFRSLVVRQPLRDSDGDGVCDEIDLCRGSDDRGPDSDADGIADACDRCPLGDDRPDADGDGVPDACDVCPGFADDDDADFDAIPDGCDVCPDDFANDNDGDGVCDLSDRCLDGDDNLDTDGDGVPDACDRCPLDDKNDDDEDGVCDSDDLCVGNDNAGDDDGDGFCADVDCDDTRAQVHPGAEEICDGFDSDCNGALRADELDGDGDGVVDCLAPPGQEEPPGDVRASCAQTTTSPGILALGLAAVLRSRRRRVT